MYYFHIFQSKTDTVSEVCKKTHGIVINKSIISGVPSFTAILFCFESLNTNSEHNISIASFLGLYPTFAHSTTAQKVVGRGWRGRGKGKGEKGEGGKGGKGKGRGWKLSPLFEHYE